MEGPGYCQNGVEDKKNIEKLSKFETLLKIYLNVVFKSTEKKLKKMWRTGWPSYAPEWPSYAPPMGITCGLL